MIGSAHISEGVFPGVPVPAGSLGLRFRSVQPTEAIVTYAEGCDGAPASVTLSFRAEPPRLEQSVPGVIPPGIVEAEPVIYVQAFLDAEGRFSRSEYLGGPRSLLPAALEALAKWSARPVRVNGVPIVNPMILQIPLK